MTPMPDPSPRIRVSRLQRMIHLYESGKSLDEVGEAFGVSKSTVSRLFASHGVAVRSRGMRGEGKRTGGRPPSAARGVACPTCEAPAGALCDTANGYAFHTLRKRVAAGEEVTYGQILDARSRRIQALNGSTQTSTIPWRSAALIARRMVA